MAQASCIWKAPFTSVQPLPGLPGGSAAATLPIAATPDGATVVGQALAGDGTWRAVRWNTATLAITELARVIPNARAVGVSSDGSIIVGCIATTGASSGNVPGGVSGNQQIIRWTAGGSAGSLLPVTGSGPTMAAWSYGGPLGVMSDSGSVVGGWDFSAVSAGATSQVTKWINGVNTNLPGLNTSLSDSAPIPGAVSADGLVMVGHVGQHNQTTLNQPEAGYWVGTTMRRLAVPPECVTGAAGIGNLYAIQCNHDASVIWGDTPNWAAGHNSACYWTNVTTLSDGVHYGVSHIMAQLPNSQQTRQKVFWVADDPSALVAVGTSPAGASATRACKWAGATAFDLPSIDGVNGAEARACNHDGTVICGMSGDSSFNTWAVRWDASNALHVLPTLADAGDSYQGEALGVSRDGSVIFGIIDVGETGPVDPPPEGGGATPAALSENLISLSVSYDRGHSFGSPVSQPMGEPGEYRKSLLWRRLGMGRDAVFELSWSSPRPTALQGCWLEADIGDGGQEKK
jgi:uncharacterized membrane protein